MKTYLFWFYYPDGSVAYYQLIEATNEDMARQIGEDILSNNLNIKRFKNECLDKEDVPATELEDGKLWATVLKSMREVGYNEAYCNQTIEVVSKVFKNLSLTVVKKS